MDGFHIMATTKLGLLMKKGAIRDARFHAKQPEHGSVKIKRQ